jgi:hypothetical protein
MIKDLTLIHKMSRHSLYGTFLQLLDAPKKLTVVFMGEKKNHLYVDSQERSILLHSLVELKNQLIQQGRYTDCVDELIFKVVNAPVKRMKIEYV